MRCSVAAQILLITSFQCPGIQAYLFPELIIIPLSGRYVLILCPPEKIYREIHIGLEVDLPAVQPPHIPVGQLGLCSAHLHQGLTLLHAALIDHTSTSQALGRWIPLFQNRLSLHSRCSSCADFFCIRSFSNGRNTREKTVSDKFEPLGKFKLHFLQIFPCKKRFLGGSFFLTHNEGLRRGCCDVFCTDWETHWGIVICDSSLYK